MLSTSQISNIQIYTAEWYVSRIGRATSSSIYTIMGDKFSTVDYVAYVYQKAGELVTGKSTEDENIVEDENTAWGRENELSAIMRFSKIMGIQYMVVQKMIIGKDDHFSSTPDAIWVRGESVLNKDEYNVSTLEVKCPRKFTTYIPLWECHTPEQLKRVNKKYYWQVLDQMDNTDAAVGYFVCYHPLFPAETNTRIIEFRKIDLWDDFLKLKERKSMFVNHVEKIKAMFLGGSHDNKKQ